MVIDILTLFPAMCEAVLGESIVGRARANGILEVVCHDFRAFTEDRYGRVDDYPFGGGAGMLLAAQPIMDCYEDVCRARGGHVPLIYLSPQGKTLTQARVRQLAELPALCLLCGHYEGVDQRVLELAVDEEISIGDYVLTGGELPALVLVDAVARMLPGTLSNPESAEDESHSAGLLEGGQYTRPRVYRGLEVPETLVSGHAANIARWRRQSALRSTLRKRPDLLANAPLTAGDEAFLRELAESESAAPDEPGGSDQGE